LHRYLSCVFGIPEDTRKPRRFFTIAGIRYCNAQKEEVCCGFERSFSIASTELSVESLKRKLASAEVTGTDLLVTDCRGCVLQLRGGMDRKSGRKMKVKHIAELLDEEITDYDS
jgi:Fe-S oxidoreductase